MKFKKLFSVMTASALALSMLTIAASATGTDPVAPDPVPTENIEVLYDAPITDCIDFFPWELGQGIDGAMLRFTYYSNKYAEPGYAALGFAGKANDEAWTWLQSETEPGLTTEGYGIENVQQIYYDELVEFADIGTDVRCYVFCNWWLEEGSNVKIELITPAVNYGTMTLFDGQLNDTELTPAELGKNIPGSKIRFTFTPEVEKDWHALWICGRKKDTWQWINAGKAFFSKGANKRITYTLNYDDFVEYAGIGDDLECFVFQDWGIKADTNCKMELLVPTTTLEATTATATLFSGELSEEGVALTHAQLGAYTPGSEIKITYTGANEEGEAAVGICGNGAEWYTGFNCLASIGSDLTNTYITTYAEFVEFVGITAPINTYVFQNWGLTEDSLTTIELIIPVDPYKIETILFDNTVKQGESITFTPQQLGQGIDGARLKIIYEAKDEIMIDEAVVGIAGISNDGRWLQGKNIPSLIKRHGGTNVEELTYDEFVKLANIKESDVNYYVFSNWNLKLGTKFKIILVTYA